MHDILGIFYLFYCPLFIYFGTRHVITLFIWLKVKLKSETSKENFEREPPIKMVLVGAQRGNFPSVGHGGLDR